MARYRPPMTVGLPFEAWPDLDRRCWEFANREGDLLTGRGPAASWKPKTRFTARKAYGNWLRFLRDTGRLTEAHTVGARLTPENLRAYIGELRSRASPNTVLTQLRYLSATISVMDHEANRDLLKLALSRLTPSARQVRDKVPRLISPVVLLELGRSLIANWQTRTAHDPRLNAMDYRDGLMIAMLALCPIRLGNLAAVVIGEHLNYHNGRPHLAFTAQEMKSGRPLEFELPCLLHDAMETYLRDIHPKLYVGEQRGSPLWPSLAKGKPQMSERGIYTRITQVTKKHLGRSVSPHLFRDAAATFITELAPEHAAMAAAVLQHANLQVTMRHYVHGQQHQAAHKYHAAIDDLIARVAAEPLDLGE